MTPAAADEDMFGQNLVDRTAGLLHSLLQQDPAVAGQLVACLQAVLHSSTILMDRLRSAAQEAQAQARQCDGPATLCPQVRQCWAMPGQRQGRMRDVLCLLHG